MVWSKINNKVVFFTDSTEGFIGPHTPKPEWWIIYKALLSSKANHTKAQGEMTSVFYLHESDWRFEESEATLLVPVSHGFVLQQIGTYSWCCINIVDRASYHKAWIVNMDRYKAQALSAPWTPRLTRGSDHNNVVSRLVCDRERGFKKYQTSYYTWKDGDRKI